MLGEVELGVPRVRAQPLEPGDEELVDDVEDRQAVGRPASCAQPVDEHTVLHVERALEAARAAADPLPRIEVEPHARDDVERRRLERVQHAAEIRAALEDHVVVTDEHVRRLHVPEAEVATARRAE